ncbi:MAG: phenylalanine--tRNA ligase subunit beta [Patescibacteria group bacterium]|nr:phenylalanine--tRNA ligase subunit beta [Patescibacteria group bacterium]
MLNNCFWSFVCDYFSNRSYVSNMKIPLNWLAEYVDTKGLTLKKLSDGLRLSGTENVLLEGSSFPNFVVGEIKNVEKHPDADKLQVAKVDVGKKNGGVLQIVCGAPNIKVGQKVPVALLGAKVGDFEIKKAKIRGVESSGMMCAEDELGLGEDHEGIMILEDYAKVGQPLSEYFGGNEPVIDAEITPNRGDCLSVTGIAREVAATFSRKLKKPKYKKVDIKSKKKIKVEVKDKELCPRYIAKVVEGVKIGPSPKWLQERLLAAGVRPISNVVDVTNYVMLEWGQPLHAFDARKIKEKIVVRRAKKGEKMVTLDSVERKLTPDDLLICDSRGPVALAGVMGGENSEISNSTTEVILEAAVFDSVAIRKTAQRIGNRTEASNRFEKKVPLGLPEIAIERAVELLTETAGGKAGENTDVLSSWIWIQHVGLRIKRVEEVLGIEIDKKKIIETLTSLGFLVEEFDFKKEARKHVGKPYIWGAKFKTHGDMAFDCSYLTDYIYSQIGQFIGYVCLGQYELGEPVKDTELRPGDILFLKGLIKDSPTDHYYIPDGEGGYEKINCKKKEVGHNALYIGDGRVIHARHYEYDRKDRKWRKLPDREAKVVEENVEVFTKHPEYLGARRYIESPENILAVTAPWWRLDVRLEEDLIEEIARIYGYDKLPTTLPSGLMPLPKENKNLNLVCELKTKLLGAGYSEVMTYSFVSEKEIKVTDDKDNVPKIENPLSEENEYMRSNLAVSLLSVAAKNQENFDQIKIFEIANVYSKKAQELRLGMLVKMGNSPETLNFPEIKGALELLLGRLNIRDVRVRVGAGASYLGKGQAAEIFIGKENIGHLGVFGESIRDDFGVKGPVAVAEIYLEKLSKYYGKLKKYQPLPKYPCSLRDINMVFADSLLAEEIIKTLKKVNDRNLSDFKILDIYRGKGLPEGKKSVTIRLVIGSSEKTLTEEEINATVDEVIQSLSSLGGKIRS